MNTYLVVTKHQTRIYVADCWWDLIDSRIIAKDEDILSISRLPDNCEMITADIY